MNGFFSWRAQWTRLERNLWHWFETQARVLELRAALGEERVFDAPFHRLGDPVLWTRFHTACGPRASPAPLHGVEAWRNASPSETSPNAEHVAHAMKWYRSLPAPEAARGTSLGRATAARPARSGAGVRVSTMLSVCITVRNRSLVKVGRSTLRLLPNCIDSLRAALLERSDVELVISDWESDDWPLRDRVPDAANPIPSTLVTVTGPFSRGRGLNVAADAARVASCSSWMRTC